jgi:hypothetical protein
MAKEKIGAGAYVREREKAKGALLGCYAGSVGKLSIPILAGAAGW